MFDDIQKEELNLVTYFVKIMAESLTDTIVHCALLGR